MKKKIFKFCAILFCISVLVYIVGSLFHSEIITDDIGDYFLWIAGFSAALYIVFKAGFVKVSNDLRRILNIFLGPLIFILVVFGLWGLFTEQGKKRYDEMSGLIPFYALVVAVTLLLVLAGVNFLLLKKSLNRNNKTN